MHFFTLQRGSFALGLIFPVCVCAPDLHDAPQMLITLLKSKIHRATVTGAHLDYEGSLTVSSDLAECIGLRAYEKILVGNMQNGHRFETYVIYGKARGAEIILNGATSHLGKKGDRLTIMSFASFTEEEAARHRPQVLVLDEKNQIVRHDS